MSVMLSVHGIGKRQPTLREAADLLRVRVEQLDAIYGVKLIDPWAHLYAVRANSADLDGHESAQADLGIGTFGRK
jgi:hypothetical protein